MLVLKGKLKRLNAGMSREDFWEMARRNLGWSGGAQSGQVPRIRALVASAHRVKPEYEAEVAAFIQMLCESGPPDLHMHSTLRAFAITPIRAYVYSQYILAVETSHGWLVYPLNMQHVNRLLSRKERSHD
jgi:hypothetical protein